ncbi:galactose oxidase-like domain-containing protein [Edaphobacter aggregans]|uniref:galactose oxidase-like domain-containing protein n=1 Tax=Edaphobacter aggregans TaxID=570835 RepID=UPI00068D6C82|nr:galactose oxidase-like domain-containing protein [Edaphobacter aggregans]
MGITCVPVLAQTPAAGIIANPTVIASGGSSTLTWTTNNAVSADLNGTTVPLNGSQTVSPTVSTTYRITAHSSTGATDWGQVLVTVTAPGAPTAAISASPASIAAGGSSTLTWTSTNAVSATLNGAPVAVNGSQTVSPTTTTAYTFIATSSSGATASKQATVTVGSGGAPTAGIIANPTSIASGGSSTLTWTTSNAVSADLNGTPVALNGSQTVSPTASTTYRITARNSAGAIDWGQVLVTVTSSGTTAGITANPTSIPSGGSSTLTWTSTNAVSATLNGASVAVNGSQTVSPTATSTYNFVATGSSGTTASAQATVTVTSGGTPAAGLTANPTSIVAGNSSTLTWTTSNAVSADLNGVAVPLNGSQVVSPITTTAYRITAHGSSGATDWGQVSVTVTGTGTGDPAVKGQWGPVQTWPFMAAHAALLPNGSVFFWPSFGNGNNPYLWNPATNQFTAAPKAGYNIFCAGHSFLQDGKLFLAGGHAGNQNDGVINSTFYDPSQNTWTATANMNAPRWYPTNTTLPNGDVLVVSGFTTNDNYNTLPQVWRPANNTWRNLTSAQLMQPLYPMMFVAPNGKAFSAGPDRISRYLDTSGTGAWTTVGTINYTGPRDYGSAVMFDGKVMVAGGDGDTDGAATNTAEIIDLNAANPTWQFTSPMSAARRQLNLTLLPDGKVFASGGSGGFGFDNSANPVYPAEMWDPATGSWTTMNSVTVYRGYHSTALLLPDGRVLSAGGEITGASAEIYSPPYLFKGARPTVTSAPTSVKYGQTFLIGTPDAANITKVTWIRLGAVTHALNQNQRLNNLQFAQATGGLNITAPANANLAPPGHYMLFLVNGNGVPSVAKIIQITP